MQRRPWVDWIHTTRDLGALIRGYIKWDDQPASVAAALERSLRARQIAQTAPRGPVYVRFDAGLQEDRLPALPPLPDVARFQPPPAMPRRRAAIAQRARVAAATRSGRCCS